MPLTRPTLLRIALALLVLAAVWWLRRPGLATEIWNVDEAVTFTMAQQILAGDVPYRDAVDQRTPLVPYFQAAVFAAAGDWNLGAQHLVLALLVGGIGVLAWQIARAAGDEAAGVAGALWLVLLAFMLPSMRDTMAAHTGWYLAFVSTLGFWLLARSWPRPGAGGPFLSGLCFGLAVLAKQPGVLDFGVALVVIAISAWFDPDTRPRRWRQAGGLLAGFAAPLAATGLWFAQRGAWADFVYYTWTYNRTLYVPEVPLAARLLDAQLPFALAWEYHPVVFVTGVAAAVWLAARNLAACRHRRFELLEWLVAGWCVAGLYACTLSGRGFSHYAMQLIPGLALACGWVTVRVLRGTTRLAGQTAGRILGALLCAALAWLLLPPALERRRHLPLPVDGGQHLAQFVAAHTGPADRVHVWGYNAEILAHARRLPATRFLYDTFLTGLIPWTNLDPLRDTAYAVVPGAWDAFSQDWRRHPPAVFVDTGALRGWLKYPVEARPELWSLLRRDYAEVELNAVPAVGYRLFKRLETIPAGLAAAPGSSPGLSLQAPPTGDGGELRIVVTGAANTVRLGLSLDGRLVRLVACAPGRPAEAAFRLEPALLSPGEHRLQAVAGTAGALTAGPEQVLRIGPEYADRTPRGGPPLWMNGTALRPLSARMSGGRPMPAAADQGRWAADAPSELVYPLQPQMDSLTLRYGLNGFTPAQAPENSTDGIEAVVTMEEDSGRITRVLRRSFDLHAARGAQGLAVDRVLLPPHGPGRLRIAFTPGAKNNPAYDWSFWRSLVANEPLLRLDEAAPLKTDALAGVARPAVFNGRDVAVLGVGATVEFATSSDLTEIRGVFGLLDAAWTGEKKSPPVRFSVSLHRPDAPAEELFARVLDPVNQAADRGIREFTAKLPTLPAGTLRFETRSAAGPAGDTAFWGELRASRLGALPAQGPAGPVLPAAGSTALHGLGEIGEDNVTRLFAHVPTRLVYPVPAHVNRLTGGFGLLRSATTDGQASDGATFVIELAVEGRPPREIWRRTLDPSNQAADTGPQSLDVAIPEWPGAILILRTEPGPSGGINRAWSYWSELKLTRPAGGP